MNDDKYYYGLTSEKEIGICLNFISNIFNQ